MKKYVSPVMEIEEIKNDAIRTQCFMQGCPFNVPCENRDIDQCGPQGNDTPCTRENSGH